MTTIEMLMRKPITADWKFEKSIASHVDQASAVVHELVGQLERLNWSKKDTFGIHMAAEEALMNAVKHGNAHDESKLVHVLLILNNEEFYARIEDEGPGFDPLQVPDPCDDRNLDKTSGRGVLLIKKFVDEVCYNESGNAIEFRKRRSE